MNLFTIIDNYMIFAFFTYFIISLFIFIRLYKILSQYNTVYTELPFEEIEILIDDIEHVKTDDEKN
jgi:hypothetical protein